jgi:hypothetical protein
LPRATSPGVMSMPTYSLRCRCLENAKKSPNPAPRSRIVLSRRSQWDERTENLSRCRPFFPQPSASSPKPCFRRRVSYLSITVFDSSLHQGVSSDMLSAPYGRIPNRTCRNHCRYRS